MTRFTNCTRLIVVFAMMAPIASLVGATFRN
jgi:hypothetical protein